MNRPSLVKIVGVGFLFIVVGLIVWQVVIEVSIYRHQVYVIQTAADLGTALGCFAQHNHHRLPNDPWELEREGYIRIDEDGKWLFLSLPDNSSGQWDPDNHVIAWGSVVTSNGFIEGTTDLIVRPAAGLTVSRFIIASEMSSRRAGQIAYEEGWLTPHLLAEQNSNG